jgi:hypothetical protein
MVTVDTLEIMNIDGKDSFYSRTNRPVLEGIGEPFATVKLMANNVALGSATVSENGTWSFDTNASNLSDGSYAIELSAIDSAGNISAVSDPFTLTIDTSSPESPRILMVEADTGSSAEDGVTKTRTVSLRGKSEPFSKINIFRQGVEDPIGTVNSDRNGRWIFSYASGFSVVNLADGEYVFRATAVDPSGNQSDLSPAFKLLIDNVAPGVPTIDSLSPDTGYSATDKLTKTNLIELRGTAEANTMVVIYRGTASSSVGAVQLGSVMTDPSGLWAMDLTSLNVSTAPQLQTLFVSNNRLVGIDVSALTQLQQLDVSVNRIGTLDVSKNARLFTLSANQNQLSALNVGLNTNLENLAVTNNKLVSIDVSKNVELRSLNAGRNLLTTIDLSQNALLNELLVSRNKLKTLNIAGNTLLSYLDASRNQLKKIDLTKNVTLKNLYLNSNILTAISLNSLLDVGYVNVNSNKIKKISVSNLENLLSISLASNPVTKLTLNKES